MTTTIKEFAGLSSVTGKKRWRTRIISAGPGSSGFYSEGMLKAYGPAAFPAGTKMNIDHQGQHSEWEQPAGTLTTLAGALVTAAEWQDGPEPGLYADIEVSDQWAPFIEQFHEIIGLSIRASATLSEDMYDETSGQPYVASIVPHPLNTVDFVTVPGANGRFIEALESWCDTMGTDVSENADTDVNQEENEMVTIEEIRDVVTEVVTAELGKALAPKEDDVKESAVSDVFSKVVDSGLTDINQKNIIRAFESDKSMDVDAAIEQAKAVEAKIKESIKPETETHIIAEAPGLRDTGEARDYMAEIAARVKAGK